MHYTVIPNTKPSSQTTTASPHAEQTEIRMQIHSSAHIPTERKKTFTDNLLNTLFANALDLYSVQAQSKRHIVVTMFFEFIYGSDQNL